MAAERKTATGGPLRSGGGVGVKQALYSAAILTKAYEAGEARRDERRNGYGIKRRVVTTLHRSAYLPSLLFW